ncbi:protein phosphatase 2C domain-containing protein [Paenibacillus gansuensis]|uniref:Protein phosphatase 2C domain-containing protein n=1 Tax=Paenibacillus gansuensis TaxID=306542 RepID=A0ABW5PI82_9BACL
MKIEKYSVKGSSPWNEDGLIVMDEEQVYGVVDGATSLVPFSGANGETGGYYAASIVMETAKRILTEQRQGNAPLHDILIKTNRALHEAMVRHGMDMSKKEELWSAGVLLIRIGETGIEYAQAGDCMLTAIYEDGIIRVITRDQLSHVDRETYRLWAEGAAAGMTARDQLWNYVKPQIVGGRQSANTSAGYGVLNGQPEAADFLEYGRINRINLKALLLMTDGLYVPKRAGETLFDAAEAAALIDRMGLESYAEWLIEMEESDPDCLVYPRVKKSDDKTAIWIEL